MQRDRKKAEVCNSHGIELIRVRFDEDVGKRARQIAERISALRQYDKARAQAGSGGEHGGNVAI